jgi:hypothetical protein
MGGNLPWWFKGIDDFSDGVATSFKTIDLNAATYQDETRLGYRINNYVNDLSAFTGKEYTDWIVKGEDITTRVLNIVVPKGGMSAAQKEAIDAATEHAKSRGIILLTTPF